MGYMHDSLYYMELNPLYRKDNHGAIIMDNAYSENYILPYSHDEVVHGKGSMINKMYGAYDEKFASLHTLYGFNTHILVRNYYLWVENLLSLLSGETRNSLTGS